MRLQAMPRTSARSRPGFWGRAPQAVVAVLGVQLVAVAVYAVLQRLPAHGVLIPIAVMVTAAALVGAWRLNHLLRLTDRRHREEVEAYLDLAEAMLLVLGCDGRTVLANAAAAGVLGRPIDAIVGEPFIDLCVLEAERGEARANLASLAFGDVDRGRDLRRIERPDGDVRLIDWHFATRRDDAGEVLEIVTSGVDVTEAHAAQTQLAGLRRLAQDVAAQDDARESVVEHAVHLAGAAHAQIVESGVVTATSDGYAPEPDPDAAEQVLVSGDSVWIDGTLYEPIVVERAVAGVLVLAWERRIEASDAQLTELVALLAGEAAVALRRLMTMRRLQDAALTDGLTGIANRRAFDAALPLALARAARLGTPLALATMDLNDFKPLNDTQGHEAGDRVLKATASAWSAELRTTDTLARLGGDEFAIVLPECGPADLELVERRLREAVPHAAGASIGLVLWDGREEPFELLARADEALYADKARAHAERLDDRDRLHALEATGLMAGSGDDGLDEVTRVTQWLLGVPKALVSLVDDEKQVFASQCGLTGWAAEQGGTPLSHSFCQHPVQTGRPLVVEDARSHPLVHDNPAIEDFGVVAYAGMPLSTPEGQVLGVLCAIDGHPRHWTPTELETLRRLADRAQRELSRRLTAVAR